MSDYDIEKLLYKVGELQERIEELSRDDVYGIWTRGAFLQFCRVMPRGKRKVVFLDFNNMHDLNHQLGYKEVDRRIKRTFSIPFRSSDIIARWYSGDEIVILFDGVSGAERKMEELERSAAESSMSFSYEIGTWQAGKEDVIKVIDELAEKDRKKSSKR